MDSKPLVHHNVILRIRLSSTNRATQPNSGPFDRAFSILISILIYESYNMVYNISKMMLIINC